MLKRLKYIKTRQAFLRDQFDVRTKFEELEESCIPSYVHRNTLAGSVAWWRLFTAEALFARHAPLGPVLDFGAGSGELANLIGSVEAYDFVEEDEVLSRYISETSSAAKHVEIDALEPNRYSAIFALDSLEHNDNFADLLGILKDSLSADGILILSGPTENWMYRLGRRIAGFEGHYHVTTIYDIERACAEIMTSIDSRVIPVPGLAPLFRISAWKKG